MFEQKKILYMSAYFLGNGELNCWNKKFEIRWLLLYIISWLPEGRGMGEDRRVQILRSICKGNQLVTFIAAKPVVVEEYLIMINNKIIIINVVLLY